MKTLAEVLQSNGGIFLVIQVLLIVMILILSIQRFVRYFGNKGPSSSSFFKSHHAILFLGIFALVWGMFTQLLGLIQALNAIIAAADVSPALLWMGLRVSFNSPAIGMGTMLLAAIFWGILHGKYTSVQPR